MKGANVSDTVDKNVNEASEDAAELTRDAEGKIVPAVEGEPSEAEIQAEAARIAEERYAKVKGRITDEAKKASDNPLSAAALDWRILKPNVQTFSVILYAVAAGFLTFTTGNPYFGFVAGFLLGTLYVGYPFAISGKYDTPALFDSMKLSARSIVAGRYLFIVLLCIAVALSAAVFSYIGMYFSTAAEQFPMVMTWHGPIGLLLVLIAVFMSVTMIQLAFYFVLGYEKARYVGLLPLVVAAALLGGLYLIAGGDDLFGGLGIVFSYLRDNTWVIGAAWGSYLAIALLSYLISLTSYKKQLKPAK